MRIRKFEKKLCETYNKSMDDRLLSGLAVGGSRTGSKLFDLVVDRGFTVEGFGVSDWSVFPWDRSYPKEVETFLESVIYTMYHEGLKYPFLNPVDLESWYKKRREDIAQSRLVFIAHQTDILAHRQARAL